MIGEPARRRRGGRRSRYCVPATCVVLALIYLCGLATVWWRHRRLRSVPTPLPVSHARGPAPTLEQLQQQQQQQVAPVPPDAPLEIASAEPPHGCALDDGGGGGNDDAPADASGSQRYLLYQPQFGLSNQIVALRNAAVWALLLNRTLVLPHLLGHGTAQLRAAHGAAFNVESARSAVSPLRIEEMDSFLGRGLAPRRLLVLDIAIKMRGADDAYFDQIGLSRRTSAPPLRVPLRNFTPTAILAAFGGCGHHRALAFRSLFAALDVKRKDYPPPGMNWLNKRAMPELLRPAPPLAAVVDVVVGCLTNPSGCDAATNATAAAAAAAAAAATVGSAGSAQTRPLACVHIRRGDFVDECAKYERELASDSPRGWVLSHARFGYSCYASDDDLRANIEALLRRLTPPNATSAAAPAVSHASAGQPPPALFVSVEDAAVLRTAGLDRFNLSSLSSSPIDSAARGARAAHGLELPDGIANVLIDQLTCARAQSLLLNAWSTFSQLVMGRVGMQHPDLVGWTRDLAPADQRRVGVGVAFWRTNHWAEKFGAKLNPVVVRAIKPAANFKSVAVPKT